MRGDHGNTQTGFGELDLIDQHLIGAAEEVASLPSQPRFSDNTVFKRFFIERSISFSGLYDKEIQAG